MDLNKAEPTCENQGLISTFVVSLSEKNNMCTSYFGKHPLKIQILQFLIRDQGPK